MMISEKGLISAMKKAAKGGGYRMLVEETSVVFFTHSWYVRLDLDCMSRKLAALLVEHTGKLPYEGDCLWVTKKEDPQMVLEDTMREEVRKWATGKTVGAAVLVPVMFKGWQLFQTEKQECFAVEPELLGLLDRAAAEKGSAVAVGGDRLIWNTVDGAIILPAFRPMEGDGNDALLRPWQALESACWK